MVTGVQGALHAALTGRSTSGCTVGFNSRYHILRDTLINGLRPEAGGQGWEGSDYRRNRGIGPPKSRRLERE